MLKSVAKRRRLKLILLAKPQGHKGPAATPAAPTAIAAAAAETAVVAAAVDAAGAAAAVVFLGARGP